MFDQQEILDRRDDAEDSNDGRPNAYPNKDFSDGYGANGLDKVSSHCVSLVAGIADGRHKKTHTGICVDVRRSPHGWG